MKSNNILYLVLINICKSNKILLILNCKNSLSVLKIHKNQFMITSLLKMWQQDIENSTLIETYIEQIKHAWHNGKISWLEISISPTIFMNHFSLVRGEFILQQTFL